MLKYIECEWFTEKKITFKPKLNIIVGDRVNSNSIGKSTLLKVIDFIYGGDTLITHGKDVAETLGHHSYFFMLSLDKEYTFERNTSTPLSVTLHNLDGSRDTWELEKYLDFLKIHYTQSIQDLSFRGAVSPVTRVWGRPNLEVTLPLHNFRSQRGGECIDWVIKVFQRYDSLSDVSSRLSALQSEKTSLNGAANKNIIPRITKTEYNKNKKQIESCHVRLNAIREELSVLAISVNELIDESVVEQKVRKNSLLDIKMTISSELQRVKTNLEANKNISKRGFQPLLEIIPSLNIEKLDTIESFHNGLTRILRKEIKEKENELTQQLKIIEDEIHECNKSMAKALSQSGNPAFIVDSVIDISLELSKLSKENELYEKFSFLTENIKTLKKNLKDLKTQILEVLQASLNKDIAALVAFIYGEARVSPKLTLNAESYSYEIPKDTGTGKAYSNLILLDTSLLRHTSIPFLLHDSLLFKNVENKAIENILHVYQQLWQQSFISLDGEIVESGSANALVDSCAVIRLSATKLLYTRDWRSAPPEPEPEPQE
jgi:uncharacterized protein YydD (DUF2326 family)